MRKEKGGKRKSIKNVGGLILLSMGAGMAIAILMPGIATALTLVCIGVGGYVLFL